MRKHSELVLSEHLVARARLRDAIRVIERDARFLRWSLRFCAAGMVVILAKLAHHIFDTPSLGYLWELVVSICT